nr:hypothetical protein [Tanacetum cinerariifolium]
LRRRSFQLLDLSIPFSFQNSGLVQTRGSQGKAFMTDVTDPSFGGASRSWSFVVPTSSFRDLSGDAIHRDFFPFSPGPYYATYPKGGIVGSCEFSREEWDVPHQPTVTDLTKKVFKDPAVCKTVVDQFPTPGEMVWIGALTNDQLTAKMSTKESSRETKGKERKKKIESFTKNLDHLNAEVAHLTSGLNQATVLEAERDAEIQQLKASPPKFASFFRGWFHGLVRRFLASDEFSRVQGELFSFAASVGFERSLKVDRTKEEFAGVAHPLSTILQLEPKKLACPKSVPTSQDTRVSSHMKKESIVTLVSSSLELPSNDAPSLSTAPFGQNEEWINAMVDVPSNEMANSAANDKPKDVFVQGVSHVVGEIVGLPLGQ